MKRRSSENGSSVPSAVNIALRFALLYLVISIVWIMVTSFIAARIAPNQADQAVLEEVKGWLFVVVTAAALFYSIWRVVRTVSGYRDMLEQHIEQLRVVNRVLQSAAAPVGLSETLDALLDEIRIVFACDAVDLHVLDMQSRQLHLLARVGYTDVDRDKFQQVPLDGSVRGAAVKAGKVVSQNSTAQGSVTPYFPTIFKAGAVTPVWARDQILGTLAILYRDDHSFPEEDLALAEALGRGVGITIENARLYSELSYSAETLKLKVAERTEEMEAAMRRAQGADSMKTALLSSVSHEMRTPLSSIIGFSNLILSRNPEQAKLTEYVSAINSEARRLAELINDFLDLQRIEAGREVFRRAHVDLANLVRDILRKIEPEVSQLHHIRADLSPVPPLYIDGTRIRQAILNILNNAIKYSPGGGEILITLQQQSGEVLLTVRDQGVGLKPEEIDKLFERFYRADIAEQFRIRGTGLGLALCREIIQKHDGRIWAQSDGLGKGSTFGFALPVTVEAVAAEVPTPVAETKWQVLVLEDEPNLETYLRERLKSDGYAVQTLTIDAATVGKIAEMKPSLIVMDILQDNQQNGWQLLTDLRQQVAVRDIPILVCSLFGNAERAWQFSASSYVTKPVDEHFLLDEISRLVGTPPRRVLIVDDEAFTRLMLRETLATAGYSAETATDGEAAIAILKNGWPDLVILDLLMPRVNGFGVLEWIRHEQNNQTIPVIVLTAAELAPNEQQVVRQSANAVAVKSTTSPQQLLDLVKGVISSRN